MVDVTQVSTNSLTMRYILLLGIIGFCSTITTAQNVTYRLPESVIPERYVIEIITHLGDNDNFNFSGKIWITTKCTSPTNTITLHSSDLSIDESSIKIQDLKDSNATIEVNGLEYNEENDFLIIQLKENLVEDHSYEVFISYSAKLRDDLNGFYRSSYKDIATQETKWLAVTQFEPTQARQAFPCFDEPAMKAIFNISLGRHQNFSSISNMPILKTEPIAAQEGWMWDRYEETVPVSTYLIAFVVSEFDHQPSSPTKNNVTFRIWARKDVIDQVKFAQEIGPKILDYYETYFDIKYPLPKQDMIAIPDFSAGAMENWGLITYREALLLYDPNVTSASHKSSIASVISHELAHQWFGNLVTMKWWTDLWLNEGFATYMASLAVDHQFPEWNSFEESIASNLLAVFQLDALKTSHPVSVPVHDPSEINEIFDTISYKKGSFLLHMIAAFLGKSTFRQGVTRYLNTHQFNNAQQDDLWAALTLQGKEANVLPSNLTVKTIMDTWTLQTGFPLISVIRDYEKRSVEIKQKRFLRDIDANSSLSECWWVPLTYTTAPELNFESTAPRVWLSCMEESLILSEVPSNDKWILFNINASGLYKVNYDEENWKLLIQTLNSDAHTTIPTLNRVQLIDDSADLAWTGHLNYSIYFSLIDYLKIEKTYLPWKSGLNNIKLLNLLLKRTSAYGAFKVYINALLSEIYTSIGGFEVRKHGSDLSHLKHQNLITSWGCKFGGENCIHNAVTLFKSWQNHSEGHNPIHKDFRSVVYCTAIKNGGEPEWNFLWRKYLTSNVPTEKTTILQALSCTTEIWILNRFLEWTIDRNSSIRSQDTSSIFYSVASNDVGYYVAKSFFYNKIEEIYKYLGSNADRLGRYLNVLAKQMINEYDLEEFMNFTTSYGQYFTESKQGMKQALETIQVNIQWQKKHYQQISNYLSLYVKN